MAENPENDLLASSRGFRSKRKGSSSHACIQSIAIVRVLGRSLMNCSNLMKDHEEEKLTVISDGVTVKPVM